MIPGQAEFSKELAFSWQLVDLSDREIKLDVFFNNTDYVSIDEVNPDTVVVTFRNSNRWLRPVDRTRSSIFDGYKVRRGLPVQMRREDANK